MHDMLLHSSFLMLQEKRHYRYYLMTAPRIIQSPFTVVLGKFLLEKLAVHQSISAS